MSARPADRRTMVAVAVTALYAVVVVATSARHEPWRDEVVPLSMARDAASLGELARSLSFEGHPILWYAALRGAHALVGESWVLKVLNAAFAIGAVALWMLRAPLPLWLRSLFAFSFVPLYQYAIVSRGYALGMLLLFAFCALHPRRRERPVALALVLAALANTHAFGFLVALAAGASLALDRALPGAGGPTASRVRTLAGVALYAAGLALAVAVAFPPPEHTGTGVRQLDPASLAAALLHAVVRPAGHSQGFFLLPAPSLWLWGFFVYLARRPAVLCFAAASLVSLEVFFAQVHEPAPWHLGNALLVVVAAAWLDAASPSAAALTPVWLRRARSGLGGALAAALAVVLGVHLWFAARQVHADWVGDYSSSRRLAERIRGEPDLADAILVGEPDAPIASLAYYLDQPIYLPREGVFRRWLVSAPPRRADLDLAALLESARVVGARCDCPVVIALGWELDGDPVQTLHAGTRYEETFRVTPEARAAFRAATRPLATLRDASPTDENYDVYVLR